MSTSSISSVSTVTYAQFQKAFLTIGKAVSVVVNAKATIPAYLIQLDFGSKLMGEHKTLNKKDAYISSAQLRSNHPSEEITNQLMLTVLNFPRKQIGNMKSDCLVTGVQSPSGLPEEKRATTVFMTPSVNVSLGSRVDILGNAILLETNPRNLSWPEFAALDLCIGTIDECLSCEEMAAQTNKTMLRVNLGALRTQSCIVVLNKEVDPKTLLKKQILVLTNLDSASKMDLFGCSDALGVVCTVEGKAVLEPKKTVENGYKLA